MVSSWGATGFVLLLVWGCAVSVCGLLGGSELPEHVPEPELAESEVRPRPRLAAGAAARCVGGVAGRHRHSAWCERGPPAPGGLVRRPAPATSGPGGLEACMHSCCQ